MWNAFWDALPKEIGKYVAGVGLAIVLFLLYRIVLLVNRRRLLQFFGLSTYCPNMAIYLSRMEVEKTRGLEPIKIGYQGPAILNPELVGAIEVRDLLKSIRVAVFSRRVRDWLGKRFISLALVDPSIKVSPEPHKLDNLPCHNVISLGSQVYNAVSRKYLQRSQYVEFVRDPNGERAVRIKYGGARGQYLARDGKEVGVIPA